MIKILLKQYDEWEQMIVYKNEILLSDDLENHSLSAKNVLKELQRLGIIDLKIEELVEEIE